MIGASFLATPSQAYTDDQQQLCTGDAFRLCSAAIPDVDRVTACMIQKRAQLSPGCAQFFRATPASARKPAVKSRRAKKPTRSELIRLRFHVNGRLVSVQNGVISPSRCTVTPSIVAKK
jgi:hypothetical protein